MYVGGGGGEENVCEGKKVYRNLVLLQARFTSLN